MLLSRRAVVALLVCPFASQSAAASRHQPVTTSTVHGQRLVSLLRAGGLVLFFRHADTLGMPCDRSFRVGDRQGQRNISPRGHEQARAIGNAMRDLSIPIDPVVWAGPVYRARDTAEEAFGARNVRITDDLLADDFARAGMTAVLDGHRRLFSVPVPVGTNRILVGHRTPAIMIFGDSVAGNAFPEGAALVIRPLGTRGEVLGVWMPAPLEEGGFHAC